MTISCECSCGTMFQVSDKFAGREVRCRDCGKMITVPGGTDEDAADSPAASSRTKKSKTKKKSKSSSSSLEGMTLEERIAARQVEDEASETRLAKIFTGDIRPLLVGGCCILLGIGSVVLAVIGPGDIGAEAARERTIEEAVTMTRNERTGTGVLAGIYNTFGETGVMIFLILFGLFLIVGGGFAAYTGWGFSSEDD